MDLKQLEYFVHVAELGSFTKAASQLSVAQPALSRQVRLLEVELRQTLLLRNGRGVSTTEAGKRLLAHGRGILQQVERAKQEVEDLKGAPVGHVVVAAPPTVGRIFAATLVREFKTRFPRATIGIVEGLSTYILEWLAMGRVDIGLVHNPLPSPAVETQPLIEEQLYLIGPDTRRRSKSARPKGARIDGAIGPPLALRELPQYPLIIPSRPHAIRMFVETHLVNAGLKINVACEVDAVPAILDLVQQGGGYAVLSLNAIRGNELRGRFLPRPIVKPKLLSVLALATPAQRPLTPLSRRAIELIRELAPRRLAVESS